MKRFANTKLNTAWGGLLVVVEGHWGRGGGHLGQMARNLNRVIQKKGQRKLKNGVDTTTA
jgi:hypothetical protein